MVKFKTHLKKPGGTYYEYQCNQSFYQMPISVKTSVEEFEHLAKENPDSVCKKCLNNLRKPS